MENLITTKEAFDAIKEDHNKVFLGQSDILMYFTGFDKVKVPALDMWMKLYEVDIKEAIKAYYEDNREIFCIKRFNTRKIHVDKYYNPYYKEIFKDLMDCDSIKMTCSNILFGKWYIGRTEKEREKIQDEFLNKIKRTNIYEI